MQAVKQLEYSRLEVLPAEVGISFVDWNLSDLSDTLAPLSSPALRSIPFPSVPFILFIQYFQTNSCLIPCPISHCFVYRCLHSVTFRRHSFQSSPISPLHHRCSGPAVFSPWTLISVPLAFDYLARAKKSFSSSLVWTTPSPLPITRSQARVVHEWRTFAIPPTHSGQGDVFPTSQSWFSSGLCPH